MKTLLSAVTALFFTAHAHAAVLNIDGVLTWKVTKPDCTFRLDGALQNLSNVASGSIKLVLWATPGEFPSRGYALSEVNFSPLAARTQMNSFSKRVPVEIPKITGEFFFTVAVLEYTTSGWLNRDFVTTGKERLDNGEFITGAKWKRPSYKTIVEPPTRLKVGNKITLSIKADKDFDRIVDGTRSKINVIIQKNGEAAYVIADDTLDYTYTYNTGKNYYADTKVPAAKLYLDPLDINGSSTVLLFFQNSKGGVFKNTETNSDGGETTWGTFSLN